MIMTNVNSSRDQLDNGIEERLGELPRPNVLTKWDYIVLGTIRSWYPDLSEKELTICMWTFYTMSDLNSGNSAMYIELIARLLEHENFANEREIEDVIRSLVSKSVLEARQEIWIFGGDEESLKVLRFAQEDLYKELLRASNEKF